MENQKTDKISYLVFAFAFGVIFISLVSVIFPALIITLLDESGLETISFEIGSMAIPVLVANFSLLVFGILVYKKKLPNKIERLFNFVLKFEISKNVALLAFVGLIFLYIGYFMNDLKTDEELIFGDYLRVRPTVDNWPSSDNIPFPDLYYLHVKNFFLKSSIILFQNIRVIPFLASIVTLVLTYLITVEISKKRFAGLIAVVILLQSHVFLQFSTISTYDNFWTMFYLLSLYMIWKKRWYASPISYIASVFSKPLSAVFLPMTLFFTYRAEIPRKKKIYITISYVVVAAFAGSAVLILEIDFGEDVTTGGLSFNSVDLWAGFTTWSFHLREDVVFLMFILPLAVSLFLTSRKGVKQADSILVLLAGIALAMPLLAAFTDFRLHPYRLVPLLVFFAIGVGTLFSNKLTRQA